MAETLRKDLSQGPEPKAEEGPTTPRRLLRTEDRSKNRLESINGNSILLGTNFQGEKLVLATENSVGAAVELRERLYRGILLKKHVLSEG